MINKNLWAPWRIDYLKSLDSELQPDQADNECFLCRYWSEPDHDAGNLVLWRTKKSMVLFNRFPYSGGHLLIAPVAHVPSLELLDNDSILEMMLLARDAQQALTAAIKPQGFNVGININRCAGAGLPDHLHLHLVPRWDGDTNCMSTIANVRVISQSLDELYQQLMDLSRKMNLPTL